MSVKGDYVNTSRSLPYKKAVALTLSTWSSLVVAMEDDKGPAQRLSLYSRGLVDGRVISVNNDFGVTLAQRGKVLFGVGNPDVTIRSAPLADGNCQHIAATRHRGTGRDETLHRRRSGRLGDRRDAEPHRTASTENRQASARQQPVQGKLDELAVYGGLLSPEEISGLAPGFTSSVLKYCFAPTKFQEEFL